MGRSTIPKYRLEINGGDLHGRQTWHYGKPSESAIERYVFDLLRSCEIGGANQHISKAIGHLPTLPSSARIICQTGRNAGQVVAEWRCPAFVVV